MSDAIDLLAGSVLDDFGPAVYERVPTKNPNREKVPPRGITVDALAELDHVDSLAELRRTRGYMSAAQYRVFSQCERRRR